jgi:hypothetical protein
MKCDLNYQSSKVESMDRIELEAKLEAGQEWGFRKETGHPNDLGWILISKRKPPTIYAKESYRFEDSYWMRLRDFEKLSKAPYHVKVKELRRDVHENGDYEKPSDLRQLDNYYFSTLAEVEKIVEKLGYSFEQIKRRAELDAP